MLKSPIIKNDLFEAISFSRVSSKYSWKRCGELCCLYTIPQMMLHFCEEWISINSSWKASFDVFSTTVYFRDSLMYKPTPPEARGVGAYSKIYPGIFFITAVEKPNEAHPFDSTFATCRLLAAHCASRILPTRFLRVAASRAFLVPYCAPALTALVALAAAMAAGMRNAARIPLVVSCVWTRRGLFRHRISRRR